MLKSLILMSFLLLNAQVFSEDYDPALVIANLEVREVSSLENRVYVELPKIPTNPISEVAMYLDGLIAIGKKIWPIIVAGQPVINTNGLIPSLSVLPQLENTSRPELHQMANWSAPRSKSYRVSYKNMYGGEVIGFTYTVFFQYNGSYKGSGKYITSLKVQASEVSAAWGFNFDAVSELINVANVGSEADPVASAIIQVSYKAKGVLNEMRNAQSFYVDGTGNLLVLNN